MQNPIFIFVTNNKTAAENQASVMLGQGYNVSIIGPADAVRVKRFIGNADGVAVPIADFEESWVVVCSNRA